MYSCVLDIVDVRDDGVVDEAAEGVFDDNFFDSRGGSFDANLMSAFRESGLLEALLAVALSLIVHFAKFWADGVDDEACSACCVRIVGGD